MAFAPIGKTCHDDYEPILGCFRECDYDQHFEFSRNEEHLSDEFPHKVWVTRPIKNVDHGFRYARVLKTVAYLVIDEDSYGNPIVEKWKIKKKSNYIN